jgi:hypothetical protein
MYFDSPTFLLELSYGRLIGGSLLETGLTVYSSSAISLLLSSILPIAAFYAGKEWFDDRRAALVLSLLCATYPLFLRSSTLVQSEHIVVPLFFIIIGVFIRVSKNDYRHHLLLSILTLSIVFVHYFYSTVVVISLIAASIGFSIQSGRTDNQRSKKLLILSLLPAFIFLIYHILNSGGGGDRAVGVTLSLFDIGEIGSFYTLFVPSTGGAAESIGGSGSSNILTKVVKFFPVIFVISFMIIPFIKQAFYKRGIDRVRTLTIFFTISTIAALVLQFNFQLQYRLYYFVSPMILFYSSKGIANVFKKNRVAKVVVVILILSFVVSSPVTPLGNNTDSPLGHPSLIITNSEYEQLMEINYERDNIEKSLHEKDIVVEKKYRKDCELFNKYETTGGFWVCYDSPAL